MNKIHKTKVGREMYISQMEDSHLKNTINLLFNNIVEAEKGLNFSVKMNKINSALYDIDEDEIRDRAKVIIQGTVEKLYPYLAEAMLRGFEFTEKLQTIFGRTGKEEKFTLENKKMLIEDWGNEDDYYHEG